MPISEEEREYFRKDAEKRKRERKKLENLLLSKKKLTNKQIEILKKNNIGLGNIDKLNRKITFEVSLYFEDRTHSDRRLETVKAHLWTLKECVKDLLFVYKNEVRTKTIKTISVEEWNKKKEFKF
jgi:hypothetical protein